jgi:hypothetical protein
MKTDVAINKGQQSDELASLLILISVKLDFIIPSKLIF